MYSDVIIGFDGSPAGHDALALGRQLAVATGATTTVACVHPYQALTADVLADSAIDLSWRRGAEHILDQAREALDDVPDVTFRAKAETSPARALHALALEAAAAVIVVGSTHRTGLGRLLPGTTADQVIHAAPCAVAIAPSGYAGRIPRRHARVVGAAVDGGPETERVARIAADIARGTRASLRLLAVAAGPLLVRYLGYPSVGDAARGAADQALHRAAVAAGARVSLETRAPEGDPASRLIAESHDLDLLVVGSRGYGPLRRIVLGTVTAAVLRGAACPVLAVPRCAPVEMDASIATVARGAAR